MTSRVSRLVLSLSATASAIALAVVGLAAPASATMDLSTLPTGADKAFSFGYAYDGSSSPYNSILHSVTADASSTTPTEIGTDQGVIEVTDGAYDPVTGVSYVIGQGYTDPCQLWSVDDVTGTASFIANITETHDGNPVDECEALDITSDGTAYINSYWTTDDFPLLWTLDLTTGVETFVANITESGSQFGGRIKAITHSDLTGKTYAISGNRTLFELNLTTGELTNPVDLNSKISGSSPHDADVDSNGVLWLLLWGSTGAELYSFDPSDALATWTTHGGEVNNWYTDSFWIEKHPAPAPILPDTGVSGTLTPMALIAGGILVALGVVVVVAMRRRRCS